MDFIPLYFENKLDVVNRQGDVGVVTLWSPLSVVRKHFENAGVNLDRSTSRVAAFGTLYGNGLPELLRNLLYNPQICYLVLFGVDLGSSRPALTGFFQHGLEITELLGVSVHQIVGTNQKLDGGVVPEDFGGRLMITDLGEPGAPNAKAGLVSYFANLSPPEKGNRPDRRNVLIPSMSISEVPRFPSDPQGHNIVAETPIQAWKALIYHLYRFGYRNRRINKGDRIELLNMKVVIKQPHEEEPEVLLKYGFTPEEFTRYQSSILSPELPQDQYYGYGHRLRTYFGNATNGYSSDTLSWTVNKLRSDPESRHAYVALWDTGRDVLSDSKGHPCLVSLYFRCFEQRLTLTAIFRTHNALDGWLKNIYGLIAVQRFVTEGVGMKPGPLTVISHSISVNPQGGGLERAKVVSAYQSSEAGGASEVTNIIRDPHGDFFISVDTKAEQIIVEHQYEGMRLHTYTGTSAEELERQLVTDVAISRIDHALYLGRELAQAEARLNKDLRRRKG
ncbi:MAG: hypothetical protein HQL65_07290 [Magnetococcales bacterium]|nr:hypothetical protein [Magnetococcales bacterium]